MKTVEEMVFLAKELGASDIHIVMGMPPMIRIEGELRQLTDEVMTVDDCQAVAVKMAGDRYEEFLEVGEFDGAANICDIRCRIHVFKQQGIPSAALRILNERIPKLDSLGLPPSALDLVNLRKGIVLVTGETGSGKSTTLAAILDTINHTRRKHVVTLEDPIEYIYKSDLCVINQREIGKDTKSFSTGLRACLREDPDVILIGEMRDLDTIEAAITAAETGHLVFGTLHTSSAAESIDRMVQVFPEGKQSQIRMQLSMVLEAVLSQQLVKKRAGGRILACEMMVVNDAIRNLIRKGQTPQIANAIETSKEKVGGQTMDQALAQLVRAKMINIDEALKYCRNSEYLKNKTMV